MKMKKVFAVLITAILLFSVSACKGNDSIEESTTVKWNEQVEMTTEKDKEAFVEETSYVNESEEETSETETETTETTSATENEIKPTKAETPEKERHRY